MNRYSAAELAAELCKLDLALVEPVTIILCGSSSQLLQCSDFRETMDIDLCTLPTPTVRALIEKTWKGLHLFDFNAAGVIGLLIDYEDRLVEADLGFRYLRVLCLSKQDWIVSKLASPKVDDVLSRNDITMEDLLWVKENMHNYGGVSELRALNDLAMLIKEYEAIH